MFSDMKRNVTFQSRKFYILEISKFYVICIYNINIIDDIRRTVKSVIQKPMAF